jgi:hypothetical protein
MSTKEKCVKAIEKLGGKLEHDDNGFYWTTHLVAPTGCHWNEVRYHAVPIHWSITPGIKSEYWQLVLESISELGEAEPCTIDSLCNEWSETGCRVWTE